VSTALLQMMESEVITFDDIVIHLKASVLDTSNDPDNAKGVCELVQQFCGRDLRIRVFVAAGFIPSIAQSTSRHVADKAVQLEALKALKELILGGTLKELSGWHAASKAGVCQQVEAAMSKHADDLAVQALGLTLLPFTCGMAVDSFHGDTKLRQDEPIVTKRMVELIVQTMSKHPSDLDVQMAGSKALSKFMTGGCLRKESGIAIENVVSCIDAAMALHSGSEDVKKFGAMLKTFFDRKVE